MYYKISLGSSGCREDDILLNKGKKTSLEKFFSPFETDKFDRDTLQDHAVWRFPIKPQKHSLIVKMLWGVFNLMLFDV